ncbi:hypothetical protein GTS_40390 [Gandjariella thermophila]|uniref:Uncharacterized protein n=1 Tax=Gandjariella thermophila TaxID=1931992 RepID=A0A4D4JDD2_9PSEU|nr:hypothetical protein GTS_40390 [Gandjariella thermophila]
MLLAVAGREQQGGDQPADLVAGHADLVAANAYVAPFAVCSLRVTVRNAAASMDPVMCRYQAV